MELDTKITWESVDRHTVPAGSTLKELINNYVQSLRFQIADRDYHLKLNNNPLMKVLLNAKLSDLISKFFGNSLQIELSSSSLQEISQVKGEIKSLDSNLAEIQSKKEELANTFKAEFNKEKLLKKLESLIKPFKDDDYFISVRNKLLRAMSSQDLTKELNDVKGNYDKIAKHDNIILLNKILERFLYEVYDFVYKYGQLFLNDKELLRNLAEILRTIQTNFLKQLIDYFRDFLPSFFQNYPVTPNSCTDYFSAIIPSATMYRSVRFIDSVPISLSYKFDSPIKINFSQDTYKQIHTMLQTFPKPENVKSSISGEDLDTVYYSLALERDLRVYQYYGVKAEEFAFGYLLYDKLN